jgi:hypothetical protein
VAEPEYRAKQPWEYRAKRQERRSQTRLAVPCPLCHVPAQEWCHELGRGPVTLAESIHQCRITVAEETA